MLKKSLPSLIELRFAPIEVFDLCLEAESYIISVGYDRNKNTD